MVSSGVEAISKAIAWAASLDPLIWVVIALWLSLVLVYAALTARIERLEIDNALNVEEIGRVNDRA